jgi:hypothetical protein
MLRVGSTTCVVGVLFGLISLAAGNTGTGLFLVIVGGFGFFNYRYAVLRGSPPSL